MFIVVVLSLCHVVATFATPTFSWTQTDTQITLTISAQCQDPTPVLTLDTFALTCGSETLQFTFRDDVKPESGKCEPKGSQTRCVIDKAASGTFDRLTIPSEEEALKDYMSIDWDGWKVEQDIAEFAGFEKPIIEITQENYEAVVAKKSGKKSLLVIYPVLPTCALCLGMADDYERIVHKVRKKLGKKVSFAYFNAREERTLRRKFDVNCDESCPAIFVSQGFENPVALQKVDKVATMTKMAKKYLRSLYKVVTPDKIVAYANKSNKATVVLVAPKGGAVVSEFEQTASELRAFRYAVVYTPDVSQPVVRVYRSETDEPYDIELTADVLKDFSNVLRKDLFPVVSAYAYGPEYSDGLRELNLPVGVWFTKQTPSKDEVKEMQKAMWDVRDQVTVVCADSAGKEMMTAGGLDSTNPDDLPAFVITMEFTSEDGKPLSPDEQAGLRANPQKNEEKFARYACPVKGKLFNAEFARKCVDKFLAGTAERTYRSAPIPKEEYVAGQVREVVQKTFDAEVADSKTDVLLTLYPSMNPMEEKLKELALVVAKVENAVVAKFDLGKNFGRSDLIPSIGEGQMRDPALYLATGSGKDRKFIELPKPHSQTSILKFWRQNSAGFESQFDVVKSTIADLKKERAEKKAKEEAEKQARIALRESAEKIELNDDGGIIKQILQEGTGEDTPTDGSNVSVHYVGTLLDGTEFDSSRKRGNTFDFDLGQGRVIPCWDKAVATMKKGEIAFLTCKPEYAYGERQSGPIPPNSTLQFEVELFSWTPPKEEQTAETTAGGEVKIEL